MKKAIAFLSAVIMICGFSGVSMAYTDSRTFTTDNILSGTGIFEWSHSLPADFEIPLDIVNSSSLLITAQRAVDNNDNLYVVNFDTNLLLGYLSGNGNSEVTTSLDLKNLGLFMNGWNNGDDLLLSLSYDAQGNGNPNSYSLTMVSSVFNLDYTNVTSPLIDTPPDQFPAPEPSTVLLFGSGLIGLAGLRRRFSKN
jgi:hypothetical protein